MLNLKQLRECIIQPALKDIGLYSPAAEELLVMTCATESDGGTYIRQVAGPALGIYQMEPRTYHDLWNNYLRYDRSLISTIMHTIRCGYTPVPERMIHDMHLATIMARVHYCRHPEPLPDANDVQGLAALYKLVWNTPAGAATIEGVIAKYKQFLTHES